MGGTERSTTPRTYILCPLINTPTQRGVIISQPKTSFLGVVFDVDHDFEGPRAPKAHLDTVNRNLSHHLAPPFTRDVGWTPSSSQMYMCPLAPAPVAATRTIEIRQLHISQPGLWGSGVRGMSSQDKPCSSIVLQPSHSWSTTAPKARCSAAA